MIVIVCKCFVTKIAKLLEYYKFDDMFSDIKLYKLSIISVSYTHLARAFLKILFTFFIISLSFLFMFYNTKLYCFVLDCTLTVSYTHLDVYKRQVDFGAWLDGFEDTEKSVKGTVRAIMEHPLIPEDIMVRGFIIDSVTGERTKV